MSSILEHTEYFCRLYKLAHLAAGASNCHQLNTGLCAGHAIFSPTWLQRVLARSGANYARIARYVVRRVCEKASEPVQQHFVASLMADRSPIFIDMQDNALCLVHAMNNLLQMRAFTSVDSDDHTVAGCLNLYALAREHARTFKGDYSMEALEDACDAADLAYAMLPVGGATGNRVSVANLEASFGLLRSTGNAIGFVICTTHNHFIALTRNATASRRDAPYMLIDSFHPEAPTFFDEGDGIALVTQMCRESECILALNVVYLTPHCRLHRDMIPSLNGVPADGADVAALVGEMWRT